MSNKSIEVEGCKVSALKELETTEIEVVKHKRGKVWKITRHDQSPDLVGEITACSVPCPAKDLPLGCKYRCTLLIPRRKD